jgi:uncharacterized membrane protein YgcG
MRTCTAEQCARTNPRVLAPTPAQEEEGEEGLTWDELEEEAREDDNVGVGSRVRGLGFRVFSIELARAPCPPKQVHHSTYCAPDPWPYYPMTLQAREDEGDSEDERRKKKKGGGGGGGGKGGGSGGGKRSGGGGGGGRAPAPAAKKAKW